MKLVEIRNNVLNAITRMKKIFNSSTYYGRYGKKDVGIIMGMADELRKTNQLSIHNLWRIPKKTHDNDYYEGGEITE